MLARRMLVLLGLLVFPCAALQERAPGVRRAVYVLEVDLARAREIGWASGSVSDDQVLANVEGVIRRRLKAMERSFDLRHDLGSHRIELTMPQIQPRDRELFRDMLASLGQCELLFLLDEHNAIGVGIDLAAEKKRLETWRESNPGAPVELFNLLESSQQGPHRRLVWMTTNLWGPGDPGDKVGAPRPLLLPDRPEDHIGSGSIEGTCLTQDSYGQGGNACVVRGTRTDDFARLTEAHVGWRLGIVLENRLRCLLAVSSKLSGVFPLDAGLNRAEIDLVTAGIKEQAGPIHVVEMR